MFFIVVFIYILFNLNIKLFSINNFDYIKYLKFIFKYFYIKNFIKIIFLFLYIFLYLFNI